MARLTCADAAQSCLSLFKKDDPKQRCRIPAAQNDIIVSEVLYEQNVLKVKFYVWVYASYLGGEIILCDMPEGYAQPSLKPNQIDYI
jgi:hypothetical protein